MLFRLCLIFLLALLALPARAEGPALHHGLNLSNWFANAERQPLDPRDFTMIKQAGFDFVRLPVNPESFGFRLDGTANGLEHADFTPVDRAMKLAMQNHLAVVLDIHPHADFKEKIENSPDAEQAFMDLWIYLAKRYDEKSWPPGMLAFDLLNEPQYYHAEDRYEDLLARLILVLRRISPHRTLIVGAPRGSSLEGLQELHPLNDANIIYDFHFYEPTIITHQGIHQGFAKKMLRYFSNLPYPAVMVDHDASSYAPDASDPEQAESELKDYVRANWDADLIADRVKLAQDWATAHKTRVICDEFGVLRSHIDPASRYRWINDTRTALDKDDISWALWDYTDLFGITELHGDVSPPDPVDDSVRLTDPAKGSRSFEPEALSALGLTRKF